MSTLLTTSIVALLCYWTQIELVWAGKGMLGRFSLDEWLIYGSGHTGNVDFWSAKPSKKPVKLTTDVGTHWPTKSEPAKSWFITPSLKLPETSYLTITAAPVCNGKPCELEIYGTFHSLTTTPKAFSDFLDKFESIQNSTFTDRRPSSQTINITKAYTHLGIMVRTENVKKEWSISSIKMYHYFCNQSVINNTELDRKNSAISDIQVNGTCQNNSFASDGNSSNIQVTCSTRGNWRFGNQKCLCSRGFGFDSSKGCLSCEKDSYKNESSNSPCNKCPDGKTNVGNDRCKCKKDHYAGEDKNGPCYRLPTAVDNLNVRTTETSVNITWSKPLDDSGFNGTLTYSVECYYCSQSDAGQCNTPQKYAAFSPSKKGLTTTSVNVSGLTSNKRYKFRVTSMNNALKNVPREKWKYKETYGTLGLITTQASVSTTTETKTLEPGGSRHEKDNKMLIYIGVGAALVFVLFVVLLVVIRMRRNKPKDGVDNQGFELTLPTIGQRVYVDPTIYDDPEAAVRDFANEISPKNLMLERVLGGGEFGDVYKGTLKTEDGTVIEVAAKTLKHDSDQRSKKDFFMEASAMGQFHDMNVVHLEGVVTKSVPHMIVTEYMSNGSLDNFLKQNEEKLTDLQLVGMARGVASGMKYLAAMNFVHRDLAARNVLVNDMLLCKVADFGLSRELETEDSSRGEYCTSGGKIPVRWTAPESIKYRKFSTASDVWSYGILLWEIMSFAERPYWDWDNFKVLERVDEGYRLSAPKNCPKAVHDLMLLCWQTDRNKRPQFDDIVKMLDDWIRSPEKIRYVDINRPTSTVINDPSLLIKEWLNEIKMSSYIPHFTQAGFTHLSDLAGLLDSDLQGIGVTLIGHRNKMLRTIRLLPITDQSKKTPWNRAPSLKV